MDFEWIFHEMKKNEPLEDETEKEIRYQLLFEMMDKVQDYNFIVSEYESKNKEESYTNSD